jgi:tetratricopeptide (TPR) repeat protein
MIMDCDRIEREDLAERYLAGKLTKDEQGEFETHCFACPKCLEKLQVNRLLQEELGKLDASDLSVAPKEKRAAFRRWAWISAAAVILAAVAIGILWQLGIFGGPSAGPGKILPSLATLSEFEPPLYIPRSLRGVVDEATERFRAGMTRYQEGDFAGAIPALQSAAELNPQGANIRFFLGICFLLSGQTDKGIAELKKTVAIGDSAYLGEAHFYLAKGLLRQGDVKAARQELKASVESGSPLGEEAARLLTQLQ